MWQVHGNKVALRVGILIATGCLNPLSAQAQSAGSGESFALPGVSLSQGVDEVRAADGTSCRSSVGGSGAYVDMGLIGKKDVSNEGAYYGRLVVPIGKGSKRLDCSKLYELEVERLKLELELAKAGLGRQEDTSLDQTETSATDEEVSAAPQGVDDVETAAVEEASEIAPEIVAPVAKKKGKVAPVTEGAAPKTVAKASKLKKVKAVKADWTDDGWSSEGKQTN